MRREFVPYGFRLGFFRIVSNYSPERFALLACFFIKAYVNSIFCQGRVILRDRNNFGAIFLPLHYLFHFVHISRCVTHDVRRALFQFSFYASVLTCTAKTCFYHLK